MGGRVHRFDQAPSLVSALLAQVRDVRIQRDRQRFRCNLERLGAFIGYEISKKLDYEVRDIRTPLGIAPCATLSGQPVLATILRAGLPLHQGLLQAFDEADNAFISAYRRHCGAGGEFEIEIEYLSSPDIADRVVILSDPMLATGSSMVLALRALQQRGTPRRIHVVAVVASRQGLAYAREHLPGDTEFWIGAIDDELNAKAYIVPGLGDAGDLAYGEKA
jgi:uracil phosphoribosyltransferase